MCVYPSGLNIMTLLSNLASASHVSSPIIAHNIVEILLPTI